MRIGAIPLNRIVTPRQQGYADALRSIFGNSLIGLWPQDETAGTVAYDRSGRGHNGAYTGVTLANGDSIRGTKAPLYDGTNDFNNIYSAALAAAFNGVEGTLLCWARVSAAGVWTDGGMRYIVNIQADVNNYIIVRKGAEVNNLAMLVKGGGQASDIATGTFSGTGWMCLALTWSVVGGALIGYLNGAVLHKDDSLTSVGNWAGVPAATLTCIGAQTTGGAYPWSGLIGPVALLNYAATHAQIKAAYDAALPLPA